MCAIYFLNLAGFICLLRWLGPFESQKRNDVIKITIELVPGRVESSVLYFNSVAVEDLAPEKK